MPYHLEGLYAKRVARMRPSAIRDILQVSSSPDVISLAGGLPAAELFPVAQYAAAFAEMTRTAGPAALQYSVSEGVPALRGFIAERMARDGITARNHAQGETSGDNVLITTGSQQALDLLGKVFLDPGDVVAVERPSYLGAIQAFDQYEVSYLPVPSDDGGMDVARLGALLAQRRAAGARPPKFVYCQPNFQNPSGRTMSLDRRHALVRLAAEYGLPLIEDDPYRELRYDGDSLPTLLSLDREGLVIYVGTFSKILAPGLRLGWLVAPSRESFRTLVLAKQPSDLHTSTAIQMSTLELARTGFLDEHAARLRASYRARRDAIADAIDRSFPAGTTRTRPEGGLFVWAELPESIDTSELLVEALAEGVAFVPGESFHVDGGGANGMRLNFSCQPSERLREGIKRLGAVIDRRLASSSSALAAAASARR